MRAWQERRHAGHATHKRAAAAPTPQLRGPRYEPPYDFSPNSWLGLGLGLGLGG